MLLIKKAGFAWKIQCVINLHVKCIIRVFCAPYGNCFPIYMWLVICFWASFQLRKEESVTVHYTAEFKNIKLQAT
jgi:hypothetical protein